MSLEERLFQEFTRAGKTLALAESCTGGALAARLVATPGVSSFFLGSIVAYSNELKQQFLGVSPKTLAKHGAVSREVVVEMIAGLFARTSADFAVAISGIAGPSGGSLEKPVGTIFVGSAERGKDPHIDLIYVPTGRNDAIAMAVQEALLALLRRFS
jgi:PncC family amidohydrolase